jgi:hypothetical protein
MLNIGLFILLATGCGYSCSVFARQFVQTWVSGEWRNRAGVARRSTSPTSFRVGLCLLGFYAVLFLVAAICLLGAAAFLAKPATMIFKTSQ